jgi:hypothetical protein
MTMGVGMATATAGVREQTSKEEKGEGEGEETVGEEMWRGRQVRLTLEVGTARTTTC